MHFVFILATLAVSETLAKHFDGPMFIAAAEESGDNLLDGRGDA